MLNIFRFPSADSFLHCTLDQSLCGLNVCGFLEYTSVVSLTPQISFQSHRSITWIILMQMRFATSSCCHRALTGFSWGTIIPVRRTVFCKLST